MATSSHPAEGGGTDMPDSAPYLPSSQPRATGAPTLEPTTEITETADSVVFDATAVPFVPAPQRIEAPPQEPVEFDAKAMVDSQKRYNAKPAYGEMPSGTEASREASAQLREKARRKRQRNKHIGWFVGVLFLGGVGAAGWFGYQAYQDEQDQNAIDLAAAIAASDGPGEINDASPLSEQVEIIDGLGDLNSGARASAGGFGGAIDDAREAVGETNGDAGGAPSGVITMADVLPLVVLEIGERLPDATGRDTYIVNADEFAGADPAAFGRFVRLLSTRPQVAPGAAAIDGLPPITPEQIVISVERDGDVLKRAIVVGVEVGINVDYRP